MSGLKSKAPTTAHPSGSHFLFYQNRSGL